MSYAWRNGIPPLTEDLDFDSVQTREDLAMILRTLHARADSPSLRELSEWAVKESKASLARATVSDMLGARRLPKKATMLAFVEACGIPEQELTLWRRMWERIAGSEQTRASLDAELDRVREEAAAHAAQIVQQAHVRAEGLEATCELVCDEKIAEARDEATDILARAASFAREAKQAREATQEDLKRHRQVMNDLLRKQNEAERKLDDLRVFEREYRRRMKAFLEAQLDKLEAALGSGDDKTAEELVRLRAENLDAFERDHRARVSAYLKGQLHELDPESVRLKPAPPTPFGAFGFPQPPPELTQAPPRKAPAEAESRFIPPRPPASGRSAPTEEPGTPEQAQPAPLPDTAALLAKARDYTGTRSVPSYGNPFPPPPSTPRVETEAKPPPSVALGAPRPGWGDPFGRPAKPAQDKDEETPATAIAEPDTTQPMPSLAELEEDPLTRR